MRYNSKIQFRLECMVTVVSWIVYFIPMLNLIEQPKQRRNFKSINSLTLHGTQWVMLFWNLSTFSYTYLFAILKASTLWFFFFFLRNQLFSSKVYCALCAELWLLKLRKKCPSTRTRIEKYTRTLNDKTAFYKQIERKEDSKSNLSNLFAGASSQFSWICVK